MRFLITIQLFICALIGILGNSCSKRESKTLSESTLNELKIATADDPVSLDPRLALNLCTASVMHMLFEGLMRTNSQGILEPAVAQAITLSDDRTTYTFTLRENALWSDGTPLVAEDFEQTWKSILTPGFPAPNAYQLYVIKGAKEAKEGQISLDQVGVKAPTSNTLIVELEQPTPYFLELVSCHFYFPVSPEMRLSKSLPSESVNGNGPYKLDFWKKRHEFSVTKNPKYWDANSVKLERITLQFLDEYTGLQLFTTGAIDWAGSPLSVLPQDSVEILNQQGVLQVASGAGTHWLRFNSIQLPFNNKKMRRAFSLALDRKAIVEHVTQGKQLPAIGIVPPSLGIHSQNFYRDHDVDSAQKLFKEALNDLGLSQQALPKIVLHYQSKERNHKIAQAIQQQWNKALNVYIELESGESKAIFDRLQRGDYQMCMGSWYADILDPINFLEIFKSKDNPTNQTFWQNDHFTFLLDKSSQESNPQKRLQLLSEAERVLIDHMPVAPLFHASFNFLKKDSLKGVYISPLGYLDFKEAYWQNPPVPEIDPQ